MLNLPNCFGPDSTTGAVGASTATVALPVVETGCSALPHEAAAAAQAIRAPRSSRRRAGKRRRRTFGLQAVRADTASPVYADFLWSGKARGVFPPSLRGTTCVGGSLPDRDCPQTGHSSSH